MSPQHDPQANEQQNEQQGRPTGIPQWLEQFLNSQGGMQGLLYQVGGIQGLLQLIQQEAQRAQQAAERPNPNPNGVRFGDDPAGMSAADRAIADPYGWHDWITTNYPTGERGRPPEGWTPTIPVNRQAGEVNPYYGDATAGSLSSSHQYTRFVPDTEYQALQDIPPGLTGRDLIQYLPANLRPKGTPGQIADLQRTYNQNLAAYNANPTDQAALHQVTLANQALQTAQLGPMWASINSSTDVGDLLRKLAPQSSLYRPPEPLGKYEYATQHGYADRTGRFPDFKNIQQTLRAAGWEPSMGFGPQESFGTLSNGQARSPEQQKMLNDLLYSISPESPRNPWGAGTEFPRFMDWRASLQDNLPKPPDPFVGMQGAINRDAYVNDTLGGGFYGGLIPEEDAINTFGKRQTGGPHDPHFPTPQLRLNPMPGESRYDTYAGWASDQGAAFGTAPWAVDSPFGHAQGYDDPRRYQQPPAPGTAYPTPQFGQGGVNTFAGTQGWGNTSRNGQQNSGFGGTSSTQQQPMTFGASPWDNPWGMR